MARKIQISIEDIQRAKQLRDQATTVAEYRKVIIPKNVSLIGLPPYSPELNPAEQMWNMLRRDYFANRVFDSLNAATEQAELGLAEMAANKLATRQLTNWPWISAILKT